MLHVAYKKQPYVMTLDQVSRKSILKITDNGTIRGNRSLHQTFFNQ